MNQKYVIIYIFTTLVFLSSFSASFIVAGNSIYFVSGRKYTRHAENRLGTPRISIGKGFQ